MAWRSQSDAEIRTMLVEEFYDISSENEIQHHDYISSVDDGGTYETVPALDIFDEEEEEYQIFTGNS